MNQMSTTASAVRGGQIDWGQMRTGIMRADVVDGVPYVELMAMHAEGKEICVLQGGLPMEFPSGNLTLLDVVLGDGEPIVTLRLDPIPTAK